MGFGRGANCAPWSSAVKNIHRMFSLCRLCSNPLFFKRNPMRIPRNPHRIPGGDDGIRTHDPLLAGQVLSQLSYTPVSRGFLVSSGTLSDSRRCWHRPIFPCSRPQSIVGTAKLNFCVRNGNRWTLCVNDTNFFFSESVLILKIEQQSFFGLSSNRSKIRNSLV